MTSITHPITGLVVTITKSQNESLEYAFGLIDRINQYVDTTLLTSFDLSVDNFFATISKQDKLDAYNYFYAFQDEINLFFEADFKNLAEFVSFFIRFHAAKNEEYDMYLACIESNPFDLIQEIVEAKMPNYTAFQQSRTNIYLKMAEADYTKNRAYLESVYNTEFNSFEFFVTFFIELAKQDKDLERRIVCQKAIYANTKTAEGLARLVEALIEGLKNQNIQ